MVECVQNKCERHKCFTHCRGDKKKCKKKRMVAPMFYVTKWWQVVSLFNT